MYSVSPLWEIWGLFFYLISLNAWWGLTLCQELCQVEEYKGEQADLGHHQHMDPSYVENF